METRAICLKGPEDLSVDRLPLKAPGAGDLVVDIAHSGISTGTEKLFWSGQMPPFPGMGYPLVPGYEAAGEVVEADPATGFRAGDHVFVPGADCFEGAHGLFGGAAARLVQFKPWAQSWLPGCAFSAGEGVSSVDAWYHLS